MKDEQYHSYFLMHMVLSTEEGMNRPFAEINALVHDMRNETVPVNVPKVLLMMIYVFCWSDVWSLCLVKIQNFN